MENGYSYLMNNLIALDQQLNTLLGGACDETLSSRVYRQSFDNGGAWSAAERVINYLFWFDEDSEGRRHCELAYLVEMRGGHMPKALTRAILLT